MNKAKLFLLAILFGCSLGLTIYCARNIQQLQASSIPDPQTESRIGTLTYINGIVISFAFAFDLALGSLIFAEFKKKPEEPEK
jgi:hypothetical protein